MSIPSNAIHTIIGYINNTKVCHF